MQLKFFNNRPDQTEEIISELEGKSFEITQSEGKKETIIKKTKKAHESYGTPLREQIL